MRVEVNISGDEYPCCPLRDDLNRCGVTNDSPINSCPKMDEDGKYRVPVWCPLLSENVIITNKLT